MIAVPGEDGGVAIHGSLQCPYYVHKALKRALRLTTRQARVIQAETGGGFGGKEEYPSIIALHAALLALQGGKPVRMIYDRHEDIVATTKRHPAIVRHRTGVTRDGTLVAQDIEVVMDGGAYCTLTPVVLSRGALHAGGPYRCPNVRIRARATRTNTPPNGAFRGFGAPQTEFAAEIQLDRIAEALGMSPLEIRRRNVYRARRHDADRPGPARERRRRGGPRAGRRGGRVRAASATRTARDRGRAARAPGTCPAAPLRTGARPDGVGDRPRARLARRRASPARARSSSRRVASVELTRRRPDPGPDRARPRWARGRRRSSRSSSPSELGVAVRRRRDRAAGHRDRARLRPDGREPDGDGRRRAADPGRAPAAGRGRGAQRRPAVRRGLPRGRRGATAPPAIDQQFEPYPGVDFDDETYRGDAYPAFGWAAVRRDGRRRPRHRRGHGPRRRRGRRRRPGHPPGPAPRARSRAARSRRSATRRSRRSSSRDGRYLNDRLATYLIPTALDAPRITHDPRRGAVQRRAARREGRRRAADGRRRAGGRRRDPRRDRRLDPRPARRRRSGSSRRWARPATWPGRRGFGGAAATGERGPRRSTRRSATAPTPSPTRRPTRSRSAGPAPTTAASTTAGTTRDRLPLPRQRRARRGRRARACAGCSTSCARTSG